jgi:predicted nucleic acid-binding Zn ribbon protein
MASSLLLGLTEYMFKSLNHILVTVENQPQWQEYQQFQRLLTRWAEVVGATIALQTRPYAISNDVLYVATSGSVWVQELQFKRRLILKKLNAELSTSLNDIRFSTAKWQQHSPSAPGQSTTLSPTWEEHPSYCLEDESAAPDEQMANPKNAQSVFQRWSIAIQARSHSLPLCPQCHCPTPPGELQRWNVCGLCAAKQWRS